MLLKNTKPSSDTVRDAEFGTLAFADYGDTASYSCKLTLPISSKKVDVFFDTTSKEHLPTDLQKQFFRSILDNYDHLVADAIPLISAKAAYENLNIKTADNWGLRPVSLIVPQIDTGTYKWDITFEVKCLKNIFFIVYFDQFTPLSTTIEKDERKPLTKLLLRLLNGSS